MFTWANFKGGYKFSSKRNQTLKERETLAGSMRSFNLCALCSLGFVQRCVEREDAHWWHLCSAERKPGISRDGSWHRTRIALSRIARAR
eukprot:1697670-Amphidinium_carterae.1